MTKVDFQTKKITLVGRARTAGEYRCEACNHLGCTGKIPDKASTIQISVNDLSSKFQYFDKAIDAIPFHAFHEQVAIQWSCSYRIIRIQWQAKVLT